MLDEELISQIYEAPIAKPPWRALLESLRQRVGAHCMLMSFSLFSEQAASIDIYDSDWLSASVQQAYYHEYFHLNPIDYDAMVTGHVYGIEDFLTLEEYEKTEFYRDFCHPHGIESTLAMCLGNHNGMKAWISCARDRSRGKFSEEDRSLLKAAAPHLSRALKVYSILEQQRSQSSIYARTIDSFRLGIVLLDRSGLVMAANSTARELLRTESGVLEKDKRLAFSSVFDQKRFADSAHEVMSEDSEWDYQHMSVQRKSDERIEVLIRRANQLDVKNLVNPPALVVYLKCVTAEQLHAETDVVSEMFGLTLTEAKLAVMIANGFCLKQVSDVLGITLQTARTYCKRVLTKTGVNRQADLVRILHTSLAMLA